MRPIAFLAFLICAVTQAQAADLVVCGAGSLREAVGQVAQEWGAKHGVAVRGEFGPSGRMRERIERGEAVDLFTSADIGHAARLVSAGRAQVMAMFARNSLCALAPAGTGLAPDRLLDYLLDPALRIGTSPAKIDPLGDYTEVLLQRAEAVRPGAGASLRARSVVLDTPLASPASRSGDVTTEAFQDGRIGAAIVYCSGRARYAKLLPAAALVPFPAALETGPEYGLAVVSTRPEAMSLALVLLSPDGQRVLAGWSFTPVTLPTP